jgi:hypothetical protein
MGLIDDIQAAIEAKDYPLIRSKMAELIAEQKEEVVPTVTDEELLSKGIDLLILGKERELRDKIKQAEQDGDFVASKEYMRELLQLQQLQPLHSKVRMFV